jgi:hypothetical protein
LESWNANGLRAMTKTETDNYEQERDAIENAEMERWAKRNAHHPTDRLPVQLHGGATVFQRALHGGRKVSASVPRIVAEAAWEGYAADGHGSQSCETLHKRGGFSVAELGYYLTRAVDEGRVEIKIVREKE